MLRRTAPLLFLIFALAAAGQEPARKAEDYPARMRLGEFTIGVENLGPSVPSASGGLYVDDYIVIGIAVFPAIGVKRAPLSQRAFSLRINGAKIALQPDSPDFVAAAIKYPNWENQRELTVAGSAGNAGVILSRNDPVARFPGDRRPVEYRRPVPNPGPRVDSPVEQRKQQTPVEEQVRGAALPEGEVVVPVTGALYFHYTGKLKKVKSLELVYEGPLGAGSVRIP
jgi:hypothetical protein